MSSHINDQLRRIVTMKLEDKKHEWYLDPQKTDEYYLTRTGLENVITKYVKVDYDGKYVFVPKYAIDEQTLYKMYGQSNMNMVSIASILFGFAK